ncbi:MAG TPA: hypothetical protein PKD26_00080 [Pyrinomonadaceae bacterium]|nr:hypothetical protein [Pyrinomonadaceae bacterium]
MRYLISAALVVSGLIHLMPLVGVLGNERLTALYGLTFDEPNLSILVRHRAVLLGMLGLLFLVSAFRPTLQPLAFFAGFVAVSSFLVLAWLTGEYNAEIGRVFVADVIALICLLIGGAAYIYSKFRRT